MCLIGASGIEDKLQEKVPSVIANLRSAGIIVWVLTGKYRHRDTLILYKNVRYDALNSPQAFGIGLSSDGWENLDNRRLDYSIESTIILTRKIK